MERDWKKNAVLFLASQNISLVGSLLVQYAITWYITLETQSGVMATISIICGFVPMLLLSPFAGVWADRYNRKLLIAISDSFIAMCALVMAVLFYLGYDSVWLLFVASAARSFGSAIQTPAIGAFLPQTVPSDKLTQVNATNTTLQSLVMIVAPMISGALLSVASLEAIFLVDVVTAAIAVIILLSFLHVPIHARALEKPQQSLWTDMREGVAYIQGHAFLKTFFLFNAAFFVFAAPVAFLTPLQVARTFGDDVWRLTAIEIAFSVGMTLGGLLMAAWGGFRNRVHTMALSNLCLGLGTVALGVTPIFSVYVTIMALTGVTMPMFNTPATVLLQQRVEEGFLGRVFSISSMLATSIMPMAMLVYGPLADMIRIEWLLIVTGALIFCQGLFMLGSRVMIAAGKPIVEG